MQFKFIEAHEAYLRLENDHIENILNLVVWIFVNIWNPTFKIEGWGETYLVGISNEILLAEINFLKPPKTLFNEGSIMFYFNHK